MPCREEIKAMARQYPRPATLRERNRQQIAIAAYCMALTPEGMAVVGAAYAEVYP